MLTLMSVTLLSSLLLNLDAHFPLFKTDVSEFHAQTKSNQKEKRKRNIPQILFAEATIVSALISTLAA